MQFFHEKCKSTARWPQHNQPFGIILVFLWAVWQAVCSWPLHRKHRNSLGVSKGPLSVLQHTFQYQNGLKSWRTEYQPFNQRREWVLSPKNPACLECLSSQGTRPESTVSSICQAFLVGGDFWKLTSVYFSGDFMVFF